jgi:YVTN family beta-propeller protein
MSKYREPLERESQRFELAPGALERMHRRRRRRDRNRRMGAGVLALVVAASGALLLVRAFGATRPDPVPASQPRIAGRFTVGTQPEAVAVVDGSVWVADSRDRAVFRLDPGSGEILQVIETPPELGPPVHLVVGEGGVWVQTGSIEKGPRPPGRTPPLPTPPTAVRIDPTTGAVTSTIPLSHSDHARIAVGLGAVWAGNETGVITGRDPDSGEVVARISGTRRPLALAVGEGAVWVAAETPLGAATGTVWRIDPGREEAAETSVDPGRGAVAVGEGAVWVTSQASGTVSRLDPDTGSVEAVIDVGGLPFSVATGDGSVWVADLAGGTVSRIDPSTNEVTATVEVGARPGTVSVGTGVVWVTDPSNAAVLRIQG